MGATTTAFTLFQHYQMHSLMGWGEFVFILEAAVGFSVDDIGYFKAISRTIHCRRGLSTA